MDEHGRLGAWRRGGGPNMQPSPRHLNQLPWPQRNWLARSLRHDIASLHHGTVGQLGGLRRDEPLRDVPRPAAAGAGLPSSPAWSPSALLLAFALAEPPRLRGLDSPGPGSMAFAASACAPTAFPFPAFCPVSVPSRAASRLALSASARLTAGPAAISMVPG